jgi:hypothetical protein
VEKTALRYVRQLEQALSSLTDGPRVFTQKDWGLATRWHDMGIPVGLVLELLEEAGFGVSGLSRIARKVEASWVAVRKGRRGSAPSSTATADPAGREQALQQVLEDVTVPAEVHSLIQVLLEELRAGASSDKLEAIVAERLPEVVPGEILEEARLDAENSLSGQRNRMPPEMFRKTLDRGILSRLMKTFRIPRIRS